MAWSVGEAKGAKRNDSLVEWSWTVLCGYHEQIMARGFLGTEVASWLLAWIRDWGHLHPPEISLWACFLAERASAGRGLSRDVARDWPIVQRFWWLWRSGSSGDPGWGTETGGIA